MNRHDLKLQQTATGYPALTITLPPTAQPPMTARSPSDCATWLMKPRSGC